MNCFNLDLNFNFNNLRNLVKLIYNLYKTKLEV